MEFDIIAKYFNWQNHDNTILNTIGDDCAIITNPNKIAISTDTLNEGVHFFNDISASSLAYKSLAVSLSDIASMGGIPKYFTLNLSLPKVNHNWLNDFSTSLKNLSKEYNISLIGGDTTQSNTLSITITIIGVCEKPITRYGAKIGDGIFVSNSLGGASLALRKINNNQQINRDLLNKLNRPVPQINLGLKLQEIATSCIDISDGLIQDLNHILSKSKVGADLWRKKIPIFKEANIEDALFGGDDYELCFTASIKKVKDITNITQIGVINSNKILTLDNKPLEIMGYQHFNNFQNI